MRKIRQDDEVVVIAGRDRGVRGAVTRVLPSGKLIVAGANVVHKHVRPNPQQNEEGGIKTMEAPIDASNVAIYNPETDKPDRVGIREEDGRRVRFYKSDGRPVDEDE